MPGKHLLSKDEIRERTDLAEIVSEHISLKSIGRKLRGLCPFHNEKTPSFYVDPDKGLWHCFGCKAGGDVFRFVEMTSGFSFPEAAQWLARRLGGEFRTASRVETSQTQRLANINAEAATFYRRLLFAEAGKSARTYLESRGLSSQDAIRFGLGLAPNDWSRLFSHLLDKGFAEAEILRSGLCLARNSGGGYDRFRNRIIFPIADLQDRIIAFGGRTLSEEEQPKYLNSPETPLFQKARTLYGMNWAVRAIAAQKRAIFVEGYFDLIRCHLCGFEETVATLGTALTASHLETLRRRRIEHVLLAFDADSAGLQAALRSRELGAAAGLKVLAVSLPAGHDPDTLLHREGTEAFAQALTAAKPLLELTLEEILKRYEGKSPRERLDLLREGGEIVGGLPDRSQREYYIHWLAERYCGPEGGKIEKVEQIILGHIANQRRKPSRMRSGNLPADTTPAEAATAQMQGPSPQARLERQALVCLLNQPAFLLEQPDLLLPEEFSEPMHARLAEEMCNLAQRGETPSGERLSLCFEETPMRQLIANLTLAAEPWMSAQEIKKLLERLRAARLEQRRRELCLLLEKEPEEAKIQQLQAEIHTLARERSRQVGRRVVGE